MLRPSAEADRAPAAAPVARAADRSGSVVVSAPVRPIVRAFGTLGSDAGILG